MNKNIISKASITTGAPINTVWDALIDPAVIKQYMVGTDVVSDWRVGSSITWKGEYKGKKYEDKGAILIFEPRQTLQYSHFSPLEGKPDVSENYHTITIELSLQNKVVTLSLSQDGNATEESREQSAKFWQSMLETLKKLVEK
jgi:uncharacterized protein YndB with AHSA1/START domain